MTGCPPGRAGPSFPDHMATVAPRLYKPNDQNDTSRQVPSFEVVNTPWLSSHRDLSTSGCDSSSCSYCQGLVHSRKMEPTKTVCWLRRKRSENELASLANALPDGTAPGSSPPSKNPLQSSDLVHNTSGLQNHGVTQNSNVEVPNAESIWDQALLEPHDALRALNKTATMTHTITQPWKSLDEYYNRSDPVPSSLFEVARFGPSRGIRGVSAGLLGKRRKDGSLVDSSLYNHFQPVTDIICGMEFEEHGWLLATAGVNKQVRVYSLASYFADGHNTSSCSEQLQAPIKTHRLASKLSSLAWNPDHPGCITVGDYDGVVSQLDLESGHLVSEMDEHGGRRVWSVSHSRLRPHLAASGGEDSRALIWGGAGLQEQVGRIVPSRAPVTGVQLSPYDENHLAIACADAKAYLYDLRFLDKPCQVLQGHSRPVSYVKFMDRDTLVTAATDASLMSWNISSHQTKIEHVGHPSKTFHGHHNDKYFVGLSVRPEDKLLACGSEGSRVYAYSVAWNQPLVEYKLDGTGNEALVDASLTSPSQTVYNDYCSAVAWQPYTAAPACGPLLAAATSAGDVSVLALRLK